MRSRLTLNDSLTGLLLSVAVVAAACWVLHVIAVHAEEHGHHASAPMFQAEPVQGAEVHARREGEQRGGGGGHASFFATGGVSDAVRRRRNESDGAQ